MLDVCKVSVWHTPKSNMAKVYKANFYLGSPTLKYFHSFITGPSLNNVIRIKRHSI